jgi:hypothetical protein
MNMILRQLRILSILAMAAIALALTTERAEACVCPQPGSSAEALMLSDVMVVAKAESVTRVRKNQGGVTQQTSADGSRRGLLRLGEATAAPLTTFTVITVFKGPANMRRVQAKGDGTRCDVRFTPGEMYLIYADMVEGVLTPSQCDRVLPLSEAAADLDGVRDGRPRAIVSGMVHVKTLSPNGKPRISPPTEPIDVTATGGGRSYKTQTNAAGRYEFLVLPGEFELVISLRGKPLLPPRSVTAATGRIAKEEFNVDMK